MKRKHSFGTNRWAVGHGASGATPPEVATRELRAGEIRAAHYRKKRAKHARRGQLMALHPYCCHCGKRLQNLVPEMPNSPCLIAMERLACRVCAPLVIAGLKAEVQPC